MERPFGLGLRSQLMIALMVAFGAAFVLLSVVTARLDESERVEEEQLRANDLARGIVVSSGATGTTEPLFDELVAEGLVQGIETRDELGVRQWGRTMGAWDGQAEHDDGSIVRVWVHPAARKDAARRSLFVFYLGLTALVVLLLSYVLLTYFIVRPIDRMRRASEEVASGNLRTNVPVTGAAEVARLASSFNGMASQLRADRAALQDRLEELERTTAELTTAQEQLMRSARLAAVGRLSAGVAHEIGNPLAAIRGMLDLMQTGDLDRGEDREFLGRIQRETERIHHTIRDLLDFSRHDPEQEGRIESSADIAEVVDDTLKLVDRQSRFRDISVELEVASALPRVRGDHERLRQLLLNLLFNAADALAGTGRISVSATGGDERVRLVVADDGPGIDLEILDQVFDPFVTTKPAGKGTGLGLAVCHTIVDRLGGSIHATNPAAGGAAFEVTLPTAT
ncbi:MAG: ATP-binding protein [Polyangiales bacterium]